MKRAREAFTEYLEKGYIPFSDTSKGRRQIFKFDPKLEKIVLAPLVEGG